MAELEHATIDRSEKRERDHGTLNVTFLFLKLLAGTCIPNKDRISGELSKFPYNDTLSKVK